MEHTIKKALKTGYGLGLLSLEQAKKVAASVKTELQLDEGESKRLAHELVKSSERASKEVFHVVDRYFEQALVKTGVASKGEISRVKKKLKKRLDKLGREKKGIFQKLKVKWKR